MNRKLSLALAGLSVALLFLPVTRAQEVDGSDVQRQIRERDERVSKLSLEEQLKLRAAQQKAVEDPLVQAAMEKRNQAIREFRAALRASMLRADPTLAAVLERIAIPEPQSAEKTE